MYKYIIRPFLFLFKPESIHEKTILFLSLYRFISPIRWIVKKIYCRKNDPVTIKGKTFYNRVGLSAGFDKGADCYDELSDFGFGFIEIGTVTPFYQNGNERPRVFRLPKCESILSRTGFNNPGLQTYLKNLRKRSNPYILGVNINKEPAFKCQFAVDDFNELFLGLYDKVDYFTVNSASLEIELLERVMISLDNLRKEKKTNNMFFLKLPADINDETLAAVMRVAYDNNVDGFIATGPSMDMSLIEGYSQHKLEKIGKGGLSGKIILPKSLEVVKKIRKIDVDFHFVVIGAGGVMNKDDAKAMISAGADLVQIYSGFIYSGPGVVKDIAKNI